MGIGVSKRGELVYYGDHIPIGFLRSVVTRAELPVIAVIEHHTPHGRWSMKAFRTLQQLVGRLQSDCMISGIPEENILCVEPQVWRSPFGIRGTSEQCKKLAIALASQYDGVSSQLDHNAAEGILISQWGARAAEVGALLR